MIETPPWSDWFDLAGLRAGGAVRQIVADKDARAMIAGALALDRLDSLSAEVRISPWLDGAEITARWSAAIEQTCGVTLEPFGSALEGAFTVRVVPRGGAYAPALEDKEVVIDPDADDPPDLLDGDRVDVAAYVVEHLALEIDPFPRKPGAAFTPPPDEQPPSPFAVLRDLKPKSGDG